MCHQAGLAGTKYVTSWFKLATTRVLGHAAWVCTGFRFDTRVAAMVSLSIPLGPSPLEKCLRQLREAGTIPIVCLCPSDRIKSYADDTISFVRERDQWRMVCPGAGAHAIICYVNEKDFPAVVDSVVPYKKLHFPRRRVMIDLQQVGGE